METITDHIAPILNARLQRDGEEKSRRQAEDALWKQTHDLSKRVKELDCLYAISDLREKQDISLEETLQGTVDLIPPGWQYSEITCARIILEGQIFTTNNFEETIWKQASDIIVHGDRIGTLEICYLEEKPQRDEGPFLKEERNLINAIAQRLGRIVERVRVEEALRENEERFRSISASAQDGIIMMDNDGNTSYWNEAAERIFRYTKEEVVGKEVVIFLGPERYHEAYKKGFSRFRETGQGPVVGKTLELSAIRKDGTEFPIELSVSAVKIKGKWHSIGIARDITERKRAEEALRASLKEKEILLQEVHHRVKNNMQLIHRLIRLQSRYIQDKMSIKMLKEIQNRVKSMSLIHEKL